MMAMLDEMSPEEREAAKPQVEEQINEALQELKAEVQQQEDAYKADKAAYDAAALKVLDTNGDGTIQLDEFLRALEPGTELNNQLHIALGFISEEVVEEE